MDWGAAVAVAASVAAGGLCAVIGALWAVSGWLENATRARLRQTARDLYAEQQRRVADAAVANRELERAEGACTRLRKRALLALDVCERLRSERAEIRAEARAREEEIRQQQRDSGFGVLP